MSYDTSLKNGDLGGQTIYGGTAANEDLIIESTANATKGDISLNPTGGNVGIGINPPTNTLHVVDTVSNTGVQNAVLLDITGAGNDANRKIAERINLNPGYTGTAISACILAKNDSIQSEQSWVTVANIVEAAKGNFAIIGDANHNNANGSGVGVLGFSTGGVIPPKFNTGVMGASYNGVGVYGMGGYAGNRIGGFFEAYNSSSRTDMTVFGNAGIVVTNGTSNTDDIARFYNNTTKVGAIDKTGRVEPITTTTQLRLSYTEGVIYTDFTTDASGNMTIAPTGGYVFATRFGFDTSTYFIDDAAAPGVRLYLDGAKYVKIVNLAGIATVFSANDNFIQFTSGNAVLEGAVDAILSTSSNTKVSLAPNRVVVLYAQNGHVYIPADSSKLYWGAGNDMSIYYDGTDAFINPKEVGTGYLRILGGAKVGDGGTTNYTQFDTTGHQTMVGTARPWRDELSDAVNLQQTGPGVSRNASEATVEFTNAANLSDYIYTNIQLNHDKDLTVSIYPHIHFFQDNNNAPNFLLQYRWQINGGAKVTAWQDLACNSLAHTYSAGTLHQIAYSAAIAVPVGTNLSDIVQFRIIRDTGNASGDFAGADPYTGTVGVLAFDVHFMINSLGSTDEFIK